MASLYRRRYATLRAEHFAPLEAKHLARLPKNTPALKRLRADRVARWEKFTRLAQTKIASGKWRKGDLAGKWLKNLSRLYYKRGWRVQVGPAGNQQAMKRGSPNPFAMYRGYIRETGGDKKQGIVSPWQVKQIRHGKTLLDKGLIFVQGAKKKGGKVNKAQVEGWIADLNKSIHKAKGAKKVQLMRQRDNLKRSIR